MINFFGYILVVLFTLLYFLGDGCYLNTLYLPSVTLVLVYVFIAFSSRQEKEYRNFWLRPSYFCLLGLLIVGFQLFVDDALGYSIISNTIINWAYSYSDKAFFSAAVFIVCFILGVYNCKNPKISRWSSKNIIQKDSSFIWLAICCACFIGFVSTINIYIFLSGEVYHGSGAYDAQYGISNTLEGLFQKFFYITLASYTIKIKKTVGEINSLWGYIKALPILFIVVVGLYIILRLFSGDRGPVIYFSLALFYSYLYLSHKKVKLVTVILLIFVGSSAVSLWGVFRSRDSNLTVAEKILESTTRIKDRKKSISPGTQELGESLDTHFIAVRDIQEGRTNFSFGRYLLFSVTAAIPGLKRQTIYDMGFSPGDINSADYVTISNQGKHYDFGEGSSVFAESYLELGILGMVLFGLLCGGVFKNIDYVYLSNKQYSIPILAAVLKMSAQSVYLSRSSVAIEVGAVLHMLVFYYIINFFLNIARR